MKPESAPESGMSPPMTTTEILKDWTWQELQRELLIWRGVEIGKTQIFVWFQHALIDPDIAGVYTSRDRAKLLRFAQLMQRYRNLKLASQKLIQELQEGELKC